MEKLGLNEIRDLFRDFFVSKGHYAGGSASLIPKNDKSLLIINSGMAPLKPYFAGVETPPSKRMTTCQKCIRTGDIDNVGKTARHGTFFEMLGNFSFGDYFKKESLHWGWEFITEVLKMDKDRLWATIYEDDDEAHDIWREIGMPEERIVRLGKDDNFWEIGLGPCGPCSEIYYDRGEEFGCGSPDCKPGCECDRYIEFWNHVFTQFSKEEDGSYSNLAHPNIDTGMGLERLACIMQNTLSIFDVDTIRYILNAVAEKAGVEYESGNEQNDISLRIITDHLRSMVFMIADGIMPSNVGRGYVLRRLIRRAARHGKLLGIADDHFLAELMDTVVEVSGGAYPELVEKHDYIKKLITIEEEQFARTMDKGMSILDSYIEDLKADGKTELAGADAFKLYDTYGFPIEMTEEILEEQGMTVDHEGFREHMQKQKDLASAGQRSTEDEAWKDAEEYDKLPATDFLGYTETEADAKVLYVGNHGEHKMVITDRTVFYATSGGQLCDNGTIASGDREYEVIDVVKENGIYIHILKNMKDEAISLAEGDTVHLAIDTIRRNRTARGHSATHLLQQALRDVLGTHVSQAGSYVDSHYLRFDFNHYQAMTRDEIAEVERIVNEKIDAFLPITMQEMPIEEAKKLGAMAIFGEKYGAIVRVVSMGDYSLEFCGGTHLDNTGKIGAFKITSEAGIASGIRRIEAICGSNIIPVLDAKEELIAETAAALKTNESELLNKASQLTAEHKELEKTVKALREEAMTSDVDAVLKEAKNVGSVRFLAKEYKDADAADLRTLTDTIKEKADDVVMLLAANNGDKAILVAAVPDALVSKGYHAGNLVKAAAKAAGGGGGGKAGMAQAGVKDPSKLSEAFRAAEELLAATE